MSVVAISLLALQLSKPADQGLFLGLALTAYSIPGIIGAVAFAKPMRRLTGARLIGADASLRAVTLGAISLCSLAHVLNSGLYVALLAAASLLHAWGNSGRYTLIAQALPQDLHRAGNSLLFTFDMATLIVGPLLAGVVIAVANPATAIAIDAATFVVLAVTAWSNPIASRTLAGSTAQVSGWRHGFRSLRGTPILVGLLVLTWFFNLLYGPVEVALPLYSIDTLGGNGALLAWFYAAFGAGAVAGSLIVGALKRLPLWPTVVTSVCGWGLILLPFGFLKTAPLAIVCFGLGGMIYAPYTAVSQTLFQGRTPAHLLSQVLAARSALLLLAQPAGTALGGPLVSFLGPAHALFASGLATLVLGVVTIAVLGFRRGRTSPTSAPTVATLK